MTNLKSLLCLALGIAAVNARADFSYTDPAVVTVKAGQSSSSTIIVTPDLSGTVSATTTTGRSVSVKPFGLAGPEWTSDTGGPSLHGVANPFSSWSESFSPSATVTSGVNFDEIVDFTAAANAVPGDYTFTVDLDVTHLSSHGHSVTTFESIGSFNVDIVPAPEPAQPVAAAMVLGCGALMLAGRRRLSLLK